MREVMHIAENGATDLHLGHAWLLYAVRECAGSAAAYNFDGMAGVNARTPGGDKRRNRFADRALLLVGIGDPRGVAFPAHDPDEAKTWAVRDLARKSKRGRPRLYTGAIHSDVDFDCDSQPLASAPERRVELIKVVDVIDTNDRVGMIGKLHQPADLDGTDYLIGDENIADPCSRHHLGFAELRTRDADRAGRYLFLGDLGCLVRLRVRSPSDAVRTARRDDPRDVRFHDVEVDQQRRCIQRGNRLVEIMRRCNERIDRWTFLGVGARVQPGGRVGMFN